MGRRALSRWLHYRQVRSALEESDPGGFRALDLQALVADRTVQAKPTRSYSFFSRFHDLTCESVCVASWSAKFNPPTRFGWKSVVLSTQIILTPRNRLKMLTDTCSPRNWFRVGLHRALDLLQIRSQFVVVMLETFR